MAALTVIFFIFTAVEGFSPNRFNNGRTGAKLWSNFDDTQNQQPRSHSQRNQIRRENRRLAANDRHRLGPGGVALRRKLSQCLIVDSTVGQAMAQAAIESTPEANIVELGAGATGAITQHLMKAAPKSLTAIEVDGSAASRLLQVLHGADGCLPSGVRVVVEDMLELNWADIAGGKEMCLTVVSNVPFSSSSRLLYSLVDAAPYVQRAVLLLQAEVAERLCAGPGDPSTARGGGGSYSSISVEYALSSASPPRILFEVPRTAFAPSPKVGTAVVLVDFDTASSISGDLSESTARRRDFLGAAFARRAHPLSKSWGPVLSHLTSPIDLAHETLLSKLPWEVSPEDYGALSEALAGAYRAAVDAGDILDHTRLLRSEDEKKKGKSRKPVKLKKARKDGKWNGKEKSKKAAATEREAPNPL